MKSLNPCFNGRYSQRAQLHTRKSQRSLNPCFNGRYSQRTATAQSEEQAKPVLILVLMEDTLRV